jgi:hypothetical protein
VAWNAAHAIIPQWISQGIANKIIRALALHRPPGND